MKLKMLRCLVAALLLVVTTVACAQKKDKAGAAQETQRFDAKAFAKQFHHATVTVRGTTMHYVTGGTGETLVLVGGWPESWYAWRKVMPALAANHRVFAFDLPGQGD